MGDPKVEEEQDAEREFLKASIAVWREIDRRSQPNGYPGLEPSHELRYQEREAWERYRACLDDH